MITSQKKWKNRLGHIAVVLAVCATLFLIGTEKFLEHVAESEFLDKLGSKITSLVVAGNQTVTFRSPDDIESFTLAIRTGVRDHVRGGYNQQKITFTLSNVPNSFCLFPNTNAMDTFLILDSAGIPVFEFRSPKLSQWLRARGIMH